MKVDNFHKNDAKPDFTVVIEEYALGHFLDCCLYVLPYGRNLINDETIESVKEKIRKNRNLVNSYDMEFLDDVPELGGHPRLLAAIREENACMLMQLLTPFEAEKRFIVAAANQQNFEERVAKVIEEADRLTRQNFTNVLLQIGMEKTELFFRFFDYAVDYNSFVVNCLINKSDFFGKLPSGVSFGANINSRDLTYREMVSMIERMKGDILEYKSNKDSKARDNLKFIIDNLDPDMLLSFISKLPKPIVEMFCMEANPMKQAEMSSLKIIVRKACGNDRIAGTDGNYRLFLEKDGVSENVHFRYRETIIVYIIYLIDKLTHDEVDSITIKERRQQFLELYRMVYGEGAGTRFDELVIPFDKEGNPRQTQLKHCYSDIRHSVGNVCERLCEPSAPFVMKSANDHLAVLKENITVPDELMVL